MQVGIQMCMHICEVVNKQRECCYTCQAQQEMNEGAIKQNRWREEAGVVVDVDYGCGYRLVWLTWVTLSMTSPI